MDATLKESLDTPGAPQLELAQDTVLKPCETNPLLDSKKHASQSESRSLEFVRMSKVET